MKYYFENITPEKLHKAKYAIQQNGGTLYTDQTFSIAGVKGWYSLDAGMLTIGITDKPFFAPWSAIEQKLKQFFR